jgi:TatD DNase family protein
MTEPAVDSHAHLNSAPLAADLAGVLARAKAAGLEAIVSVGTSPVENAGVVELAQHEPMLFAAIGFHPHIASEVSSAWTSITSIRRPRCSARSLPRACG